MQATGSFSPHVPRIPVLLVIDCSRSMAEGEPPHIELVNRELQNFVAKVRQAEGERIRRHVELAIVTYGGSVEAALSWSRIDEHLTLPVLTARGSSPMGAALTEALEMIDEKLADYRDTDIRFETAHIWHFTDGAATDLEGNHPRLSQLQGRLDAAQKPQPSPSPVSVFHIATPSADIKMLQRLSQDPSSIVTLTGEATTWTLTFFSLLHASVALSSRLHGEPALSAMLTAKKRAGLV